MQSKISSFFKTPSASASAPAPASHNDDLAIWEKKQHHIFITYHRTRTSSKPNSVVSCSKPEGSTITGTTLVKNKKRSYAQFHLDFGQSDFLLRACPTCGVKFAPGDADDEKSHKDFHNRCTQGIHFRVTYTANFLFFIHATDAQFVLLFQFSILFCRVGPVKGLSICPVSKEVESLWSYTLTHLLTETRFLA